MSNNELNPTLLPCLRCGGPLTVYKAIHYPKAAFTGDWRWYWKCLSCSLGNAHPFDGENAYENAVADANRRPPPPTSPLKRYRLAFLGDELLGMTSEEGVPGDVKMGEDAYYLASDVDALLASRPDSGIRGALEACIEGFRLTREYVYERTLPAIPGWSWYDACLKAHNVLQRPLPDWMQPPADRAALSAPGPDQTSAPQEAGAEPDWWMHKARTGTAIPHIGKIKGNWDDYTIPLYEHPPAAPLVAPTPPLPMDLQLAIDWANQNPPPASIHPRYLGILVAAALRSGSTAKGAASATPGATEARCPLTGLPFFMEIDHPELGRVKTYGGPFDSYTTPVQEDGGETWRSERFDHDAGDWVEGGEVMNAEVARKLALPSSPSGATEPKGKA